MTIRPTKGLLAPSDVAELAGVSRAAVSNWRRRMRDFPQPTAGTASKPLFAAKDIADWLERHPEKSQAARRGPETVSAREANLWGVANELRGGLSVQDMAELYSVLAASVLSGSTVDAWERVPESVLNELRRAMEAIPKADLARVVDELLERTIRAQGRAAGEHGLVGSRASELLASLAASMEGGTLYDPACGIGVALLEAVEQGARPDRIVGHDINGQSIEIARARAQMHGVDVETYVGDVVLEDPDPGLRADVIIAEPPMGLAMAADVSQLDPRLVFGIPPRRRVDSFWSQHVVAHLANEGVGYVLSHPSFLTSRGPEAEIRENLLRKGWIKAVVALPGRMLPNTSVPLVLLVLQQTGVQDVLLIDGSESESPETEVAYWLGDKDSLASVPHAWVSVSDLLDNDGILTPQRWTTDVSVEEDQVRNEFEKAREALICSTQHLDAAVAEVRAATAASEPQILSIATLMEAGALDVAVARPAKAYDETELGPRTVDAAAVRRQELPNLDELAPVEDPALTQPGDVLVSTMNDIQSLVDDKGGSVPVGSIHRLRIRDQNALDSGYLADVVAGDWNLRFATGAGIRRIPIRDIEVPLIPIEQQRSAHAAIAQARKIHEFANEVSEAADSMVETMLTALRHGVDLASTDHDATERSAQ